MPKIKRWFPVSQDINSDVEVWQLTDRFGVTGLRAWLEILSIADRNDGFLPGPWDGYSRLLAARCQSTSRHLVGVCQFISRWLVVDSQGTARVSNYVKYHRTQEHKPLPSYPSEPSEPLKIKNQASPAPSSDSLKTEKKPGLDPRIKDVADRIYFSDRKKFARLVVWIKEAQREQFSDEVIADALLRFERFAPTVDNWYPYLDKIIDKVLAETNAREAEKQSEQYKQELAEYAQETRQTKH